MQNLFQLPATCAGYHIPTCVWDSLTFHGREVNPPHPWPPAWAQPALGTRWLLDLQVIYVATKKEFQMGNTTLGNCYTKNPVSPSAPAPLYALRAQTTVRTSNKCSPPKSSNSLAVGLLPTKPRDRTCICIGSKSM